MKDTEMNKLVLTAVLALTAGVASAATSGTTVSAAVNPYLGTAPATGYVSATVTSTASPRIALPSTSKTINALTCVTRDGSGNQVPRAITVSSGDLVIASAGGGQVSGTLAVGDRVNCIISYER
jgi:hypothetical protein